MVYTENNVEYNYRHLRLSSYHACSERIKMVNAGSYIGFGHTHECPLNQFVRSIIIIASIHVLFSVVNPNPCVPMFLQMRSWPSSQTGPPAR